VLNAKNAFARRGVDEQVDTLQAIKDGITDVDEHAASEFKATIGRLDEANDRLQGTLRRLRETIIDASLQGSQVDEDSRDDGDDTQAGVDADRQAKTLYSFIDEENHLLVLGSLHAMIDSFNDARADLNQDVHDFQNSLKAITDIMQDDVSTASGSGPSDKRTLYDEPPPSIPQLFHGLEEHAAEMATELQSLVSHYDLCVTALKHTEGGGQAAKVAVQAEELKSAPGAEESLYGRTVPEQISQEEKVQMMDVLENDALQVEDVAAELRDHAAEMEQQFDALLRHVNSARAGNQRLRSVFQLLLQASDALPRHLEVSKTFRGVWQSIHEEIRAKTLELVELADLYERFWVSYSRVTDEVERRITAQAQMRKVASKAQRDLDKLHEAENDLRDTFLQDVGEHLPRDLWPSVGQRAPRWHVSPADA